LYQNTSPEDVLDVWETLTKAAKGTPVNIPAIKEWMNRLFGLVVARPELWQDGGGVAMTLIANLRATALAITAAREGEDE
jgi:hypothetical protein